MRTRAEIEAIQRALGHTGWNRSQAARLLKISYRSLLLKIQRHKITHDSR
jgi:DNA-binding NtrC family response regulator